MSTNYSVDDLLSIIGEGSKKEPKPLYINPLDEFYDKHDIEKGFDKIPNYVLYYTYKKVYGGSMSKIGFFREFNKSFKDCRKRNGKQRYYLLNGDSFNLTREGLIEARYFEKENK